MTPALALQIATAYERAETDAGGIAKADLKACVAKAAHACGVTYEEARSALVSHSPLFAGSLGAG